ncbi:MAG: hypothetical protein JJT89_00745 [Nitriliruptoraceae bacterium]|nr:hypothetical protein [Nitriliruptoraceae bacterium]
MRTPPLLPRLRRGTRRPVALLAVTALLLVGCGDADEQAPDEPVEQDAEEPDDDAALEEDQAADPDPEPEATEEDEGSAPDDEPAEDTGTQDAEGAGIPDATLVVDGVEYQVTDLRRCEDDGAFPFEVELEYQVIAQGPDGRGQLDLYADEIFDQASWAGEEGIFGNQEEIDLGLSGDRAASTVVIEDAFGEGELLEITYDLPVLAESDAVACR